jgi:hypothetical protein
MGGDEGQSVAGHRIIHMEISAGGLGVVITWKQSQGSTATHMANLRVLQFFNVYLLRMSSWLYI